MRDLRGADVATRTRGCANWADTDPSGRLRGTQAKDKWAKKIGPTGIVGPITGSDKGCVIDPVGDAKR